MFTGKIEVDKVNYYFTKKSILYSKFTSLNILLEKKKVCAF